MKNTNFSYTVTGGLKDAECFAKCNSERYNLGSFALAHENRIIKAGGKVEIIQFNDGSVLAIGARPKELAGLKNRASKKRWNIACIN